MNIKSISQDHVAISLLRAIADGAAHKIILSTIDVAKTASQICIENQLPLSSTYKKIGKLQKIGLVYPERMNIDNKGKKVIFYRSRIKSLEFNLKRDGLLLQFNKNDLIGSRTARSDLSNFNIENEKLYFQELATDSININEKPKNCITHTNSGLSI